MSKRDDKVLIADMIEHVTDAIEFVGTMSFEEFCQDKKTKAAVIRCIQPLAKPPDVFPTKLGNRSKKSRGKPL